MITTNDIKNAKQKCYQSMKHIKQLWYLVKLMMTLQTWK